MHWVVGSGRKDLVELLLKHGANPNIRDALGYMPVFKAALDEDFEVMSILCKHGGRFSARSAIHDAAFAGDLARARALLKEDPRAANSDGCSHKWTPLHAAALGGQKRMVEFLLKSGARAEAKGRYGRKALHLARTSDVARLLVASGTDVDSRDSYGYTPLRYASSSGNREVALLLLAEGADVNAQPGGGERSALHFAVQGGHAALVELLLNHGADIEAKQEFSSDADGVTPLLLAAGKGNVEIVKLLLSKGADLKATDNNGLTALSYAARKGNVPLLRVLVAKGLAVNGSAKDRQVAPPIVLAVGSGNKEAIQFLLSKGADVDSRIGAASPFEGRSALHVAAVSSAEMVSLIIASGATVDARDAEGNTPLHASSSNGQTEAAKLLLTAGAQLNATNRAGRTPLHEAAMWGKEEMVRFLLSKGADKNVVDRRGRTALDWAEERIWVGVERVLRSHGAK
ncbi:MAG TPA: ankyrin repeat domain-containing protein [Phycisphaerae bacterium]|nr:ankyrin repeat domain-containing protein [Phycisphaerae bacterium]